MATPGSCAPLHVGVENVKTVLIVEDDIGLLEVLRAGLESYLADCRVVTATHGREAADSIAECDVDIVVTDLAMPIMDGFELLAFIKNYHPNLPVMVITAMSPGKLDGQLAGHGMLRVLHKPVHYRDVGDAIVEVLSEAGRGELEGISLAAVAQLVEMERKSCSLQVASSQGKGRLHFLSGTLVNAYVFEPGLEGEAAACRILAWDDVKIRFERSFHNNRRLIHTSLQKLLIHVAQRQDEQATSLDQGR